MTNQPTLWPSHTGIITRLVAGRGPKAEFVSFTLEMTKKDGSTFRRDAIAFREQMQTVLSLGVGARIYMRGPITRNERTNAAGATYTVTSMTAMTVLHKPLEAEVAQNDGNESAQEAGVVETATADTAPVESAPVKTAEAALPPLPEGATEETHALYTKRDGTKAWRKRPVARAAQAAEPVEEAKAELEAAPVETSAPTVSQVLADQGAPDTAMAAALRAAFGLGVSA